MGLRIRLFSSGVGKVCFSSVIAGWLLLQDHWHPAHSLLERSIFHLCPFLCPCLLVGARPRLAPNTSSRCALLCHNCSISTGKLYSSDHLLCRPCLCLFLCPSFRLSIVHLHHSYHLVHFHPSC